MVSYLFDLLQKVPSERPSAKECIKKEWVVKQCGNPFNQRDIEYDQRATRSIMPQDMKEAVTPLHTHPQMVGMVGQPGTMGVLAVPYGAPPLVPSVSIQCHTRARVSAEGLR